VTVARKVGHEAGPNRKTLAMADWADFDFDGMEVDGAVLSGDHTARDMSFASDSVDAKQLCDFAGKNTIVGAAIDQGFISDGG